MSVYPITSPISHKTTELAYNLLADLDDMMASYPPAQRDTIHQALLVNLLAAYGTDQLRMGIQMPEVTARLANIHVVAQNLIADVAPEVTMYEVGG